MEFHEIDYPKITVNSRLIVNKHLHIEMEKTPPCLWWRLWQWVFFGFVWEEI